MVFYDHAKNDMARRAKRQSSAHNKAKFPNFRAARRGLRTAGHCTTRFRITAIIRPIKDPSFILKKIRRMAKKSVNIVLTIDSFTIFVVLPIPLSLVGAH